jgi:ribosomal protein L11 methyltransferase
LAKRWPALDVHDVENADLLLALFDDFSPTAVEEHESTLRVFFPTAAARDAGGAEIAEWAESAKSSLRVVPVDVSDEDWPRRSQENLAPVTVGRITVFTSPESRTPNPDKLQLVIPASMAFGTGHHASTRLCLAALQQIDVHDKRVLDVGTGSGILAFAAARLGAREAAGIDVDPDAVEAARENLLRNDAAGRVTFEVADVSSASLSPADIVTANLTGALLLRAAHRVRALIGPKGFLVASGILVEQGPEVIAAFSPMKKMWQAEEDGWIGFILSKE